MRKGLMWSVGALVLALAAGAEAKGGAGEAALVPCSAVTAPAILTGCGTDSLTKGKIEIGRNGDVEVAVQGATPSVSYDVVLRSLDGTAKVSVGVLTTDTRGKGEMERRNFFDLDQAGAITLALERLGSVQFVTGFALGRPDFEASLVRCLDINVPAALTGCGTDTLKDGRVAIDEDDARIEVSGAQADATYQVVLRSLGGPTELVLGTLSTDHRGHGRLRLNTVLAAGAVAGGNVVLERDGHDQFVSGFQSVRRRAREVARFNVGLVPCAAVNQLAALTGCGTDLFSKGSATIDEKGDVKVEIFGAVPGVDYAVVFVSVDAATEVAVGILTTNAAGHGQLYVRDFFAVDTFGAGNVMVQRAGLDQFITGFHVLR